MASEIKRRIEDEVKDAMRARDKQRLATLRLISAELKRVEVDERIELDDTRVLAILDRMVKQRTESVSQYTDGGRDDLASKESAEIDIIREFMPRPLDDDELDGIIDAAIAEAGAATMKDMGRVMQAVRPQVQGRADMGEVSNRVKSRLAPS